MTFHSVCTLYQKGDPPTSSQTLNLFWHKSLSPLHPLQNYQHLKSTVTFTIAIHCSELYPSFTGEVVHVLVTDCDQIKYWGYLTKDCDMQYSFHVCNHKSVSQTEHLMRTVKSQFSMQSPAVSLDPKTRNTGSKSFSIYAEISFITRMNDIIKHYFKTCPLSSMMHHYESFNHCHINFIPQQIPF